MVLHFDCLLPVLSYTLQCQFLEAMTRYSGVFHIVHMSCYSSFFCQVDDGYVRSLEILSRKLKFVQVDPLINASKALNDINQELERLRQKALSKVTSSGLFFVSASDGLYGCFLLINANVSSVVNFWSDVSCPSFAALPFQISNHIVESFVAMRKPGTNIQILQQNLLQKHRYMQCKTKYHT